MPLNQEIKILKQIKQYPIQKYLLTTTILKEKQMYNLFPGLNFIIFRYNYLLNPQLLPDDRNSGFYSR